MNAIHLSVVSADFQAKIARLQSERGVFVRSIDTGRTTGRLSPVQINMLQSRVNKIDNEIHRLNDDLAVAIMAEEIEEENRARRDSARRARNDFIVACIEDGVDLFVAEVA